MSIRRTKKQLDDIIQWDVKNWAGCLTFWQKHAPLTEKSTVLALGEREGGMSLHFALEGHHVICSDYNPMPETTKKMHAAYGVSEHITYAKIDMKAIDMADESVDVVVFKSVIGALGNEEDQKKAMAEIYRVLKKGGVLLFAENLSGSAVHSFLRKKFVSWGSRWRYITRNEMEHWAQILTYISHKTKVLWLYLAETKDNAGL